MFSPMTETRQAEATRAPARDEERWQAVKRRDPAFDGKFMFAVRTTGVYCRPSCASRPAKRENVTFFETGAAAEKAGYRACKRCRPDKLGAPDPQMVAVKRACERIESAEEAPKLAELAVSAGLSPYHFHRVFKAITGVTPKSYAAETRARRAADKLRTAETVTEAIYDAGFNSSSRFYENTDARLGMTPGAVRRGGAGAVIRFAVGEASLGAVLVAATDKGVCAILLGDDPMRSCATCKTASRARSSRAAILRSSAWSPRSSASSRRPASGSICRSTSAAPRSSSGYGRRSKPYPPAKRRPTRRSPARIGQPKAVRAVAQACGANPLAIAIPCHRVVRADGDLSGYRWGVERKRKLIDREAA